MPDAGSSDAGTPPGGAGTPPGGAGTPPGGAGTPPGGPKQPPPGLRAQVRAVKEAAVAFIRAHVDLARAEADEIKGEVGRAAGLAGVAIVSLIFAAFLVVLASFLFFGDLIYGSMGWGILLGTELLIAIAITAVLVALRVPGLGRQLLLALIPGVIVALVFGFYLPNRLFTWIGETLNVTVDPALRPLAVGVVLCAILGALIGGAVGLRLARSAGATIGGAVAGFFLGIIAGTFLSISFGWQPAAGLGTATFLACWPIFMGLQTQRSGINTDELAARFYPKRTIDTTKESIEWAKARLPRSPGS